MGELLKSRVHFVMGNAAYEVLTHGMYFLICISNMTPSAIFSRLDTTVPKSMTANEGTASPILHIKHKTTSHHSTLCSGVLAFYQHAHTPSIATLCLHTSLLHTALLHTLLSKPSPHTDIPQNSFSPPPPKYQHHPPINTHVSAYPCTPFQIVCFSSEFIQSC